MATTIQKIRCLTTAPAGIRLVVVKLETSDPGLYGLGCATFTQRPLAVVEAVHKYLDPVLRGRQVNEVEDIYHTAQLSSYWRQGPVLNNAISGVDMALWDIKGKQAGMPVHDLVGGKCRQAADVYVHASGETIEQTLNRARDWMDQGMRHVRLQSAVEGQASYGTRTDLQTNDQVDGPCSPQNIFEPGDYAQSAVQLFRRAREELGNDIELLHDIHERVPPTLAIQLAKQLEPYRLFFLEDALPPEENDHFRLLRQQSSIPIAMGELYTNVQEYLPLVRDRLIDFIRVHLSMIGGFTPARKLATLCEFFGVRTAWHGPGDTSPVGFAANLALDLVAPNFGIQEFTPYNAATLEVFPGCHELREGALWPNDKPGWGVDIDEQRAKQHPYPEHPLHGAWPAIRRRDGSIVRP